MSAPLKEPTSYPDYQDHANCDSRWVEQRKQENDSVAEKKSTGGAKETFPIKLHAMLERVDELGLNAIISWLPHGRAFKVIDKKRFTEEVLPRYFEHQSEFASFQRQLNIYGFLRLTRQGANQKAYYHDLFLRGRSEFCPLIPRNRCASHKVRRTYDPMSEPDFSRMPPLPSPSNTSNRAAVAPQQQLQAAHPLRQLPSLVQTLAALGPASSASMPRASPQGAMAAQSNALAHSNYDTSYMNPVYRLNDNLSLANAASVPMSSVASFLAARDSSILSSSSREDALRKAMLSSEILRRHNNFAAIQQMGASSLPLHGAAPGQLASYDTASLGSRLALQSLLMSTQGALSDNAQQSLQAPSPGGNLLGNALLATAAYQDQSTLLPTPFQNQLGQFLNFGGGSAGLASANQGYTGTSNHLTASLPNAATTSTSAVIDEILRRIYPGGSPT